MLSDREDMNLRRFVRQMLHYPQSMDEFRVELNTSPSTVRKYMKILSDWDWAYKNDDGKFALQRHAVPAVRRYLGMDDDE